MDSKKIANEIFYSPAINGKANDSILRGARMIDLAKQQESIAFAEWKDESYKKSIIRSTENLYYSIDDDGKIQSVITYYTLEQLYKLFKEKNP